MSVCVMADIAGTELSAADIEFINQPEIAGLILFSRNYENPEQLKNLCAAIKAVRDDLIIAVDQEGGRVQRFRDGFIRLPAMACLGELYQTEADFALAQAKLLGWLMAAELIHHGVDISFAPVLDLDYQRSQVIGDRAFATDPKAVTCLTEAFIDGMNSAGMAATAKHFPGHGYVEADSHLELPTDSRRKADLVEDMQPFRDLIGKRKLGAMMPAHVVFSAVDETSTAGFSATWLQDILRTQLGFDGLIFSDDLSMEGAAASGAPSVRAEKAKKAGCNVLLICNNREAAQEIVDTVREQQWDLIGLDKMKASHVIPDQLYESSQWLDALNRLKSLLAE